MFIGSFFITICFLQIKQTTPNALIDYKLRFLDRKWVNLLTKWYIVVNSGNIFYIFALHQLTLFYWIQLSGHMNVKSMRKGGCLCQRP